MPQLKGDEEEVKVEKVLKILTPNKLVTRLPILFKFKLETFHTNLKKWNETITISFVSA